MTLNNKFMFAAPVEVVKVTPKNLEEVAEWCGGKVATTESRRVAGRMDPYVWVPTPKGSQISWAFPGMFITKRLAVTEKNELKETYSVFRKDYITKNFFDTIDAAVDQTWERRETELKKARKQARTMTIEVPEGVNMSSVADMVDRLTKADPDMPAAVVFSSPGPIGRLSSAEAATVLTAEDCLCDHPHDVCVSTCHIGKDFVTPEVLPLANEALADLPDSMVGQREALHEDAVEAEAE